MYEWLYLAILYSRYCGYMEKPQQSLGQLLATEVTTIVESVLCEGIVGKLPANELCMYINYHLRRFQ